MEQRQLEYFVAVAEELSFTRAAARTMAVQSTVSASIRTLERSLGVTLFDRSTTKVALTPSGRSLLPQAKRALEALDEARRAVGGICEGLRGSLRVGTLAGLSVVDLPGLVADFRQQHPGVQLHLSADPSGSEGLLEGLRSNALDLAFVGVESGDVRDIELTPIAEYQPRLLVPAGHPLAGAKAVSMNELSPSPFIDMPAGFCNRGRTDADFRRAGVARSIVVEVTDLTSIPGFVEAGAGVAVVPPLQTETGRRVVPVALDPPATPWILGLARPASTTRTRAAEAFTALVPNRTGATQRF
ncbi:LysR family transcriptional regulator [Kineosporia rhizophila]|uniref:LysR family transcriptional regulator n=1 Tax=Kineosporia TaxID=49184 RepID=UPI001E2E2FCE|nr:MULTISPECIES: LysR family transcriptional regulator [Kineosporia]MCE0535400.1 LysR family transcriptional regulator [Kineosporia rhizophila]GLY16819.1 LysR family transcriptional regulator [Kineosporia sp. NBRC 101677]